MPPGVIAPYQVRLEGDGGLIWVPEDIDELVRVQVSPSTEPSPGLPLVSTCHFCASHLFRLLSPD